MNDKEIMDKIKETAEDVSVPEELQPDVIEAMLEAEEKKDHTEPLPTSVIDMGARPKRRWKKAYTGVVAAAMAAIILIPTALQPWVEQREATSTSSVAVESEPTITPEEDSEPTITASVGDFGDTLHHPKNYREIYDVTKEYGERYRIDDEYVEYDTIESPSSGFRFPSFGGNMEEAPSEAATAESSNEDVQKSAGSEDYSKTNTIEEDVAEGDVTITDGKYIYHYTNDAIVEILGTKGGKLTEEATIDLNDIDGVSGISYINDMYVQGDYLVVVLNGYCVSMETKDKKTSRIADEYAVLAMVYDIGDVKHPKLSGYTRYDGSYYSSRIVDGQLYMFTIQSPDYYLYGDEHILYDEEEFLESGVLPRINGEAPKLDCIYLPERYQADPSFVMSSVKLDKPDKVQDYQVIMGCASDIYVSNDAIYLQTVEYGGDINHTVIIRMDYKDGKFAPAGVGVVKGMLTDKYAINEDEDGNLRVATTVVDYGNGWKRTNRLTIFDEKMKEIGKLSGLAEGEEIKSARYIGDYCYLVTFVNTDPLFSIDCSDPKNPTLVGELKIPGFSEYMHPWTDGKLLGFGYAGDDEGLTEGLKLTMFDISSPSDVEIITEKTLRNIDYAAPFDDYKALMVSSDRSILGFMTESYDEDYESQYRIYRYDGEDFRLEFTIDAEKFAGNMRGVFIGDVFYLIGESHGASFDMAHDYQKISDLTW